MASDETSVDDTVKLLTIKVKQACKNRTKISIMSFGVCIWQIPGTNSMSIWKHPNIDRRCRHWVREVATTALAPQIKWPVHFYPDVASQAAVPEMNSSERIKEWEGKESLFAWSFSYISGWKLRLESSRGRFNHQSGHQEKKNLPEKPNYSQIICLSPSDNCSLCFSALREDRLSLRSL